MEKDTLRWRSTSDAVLWAAAAGSAGITGTPPQGGTTASPLKNLKTGLKKGGDGLEGRRGAVPPGQSSASSPPYTQPFFFFASLQRVWTCSLSPQKEGSLPKH